jgi:hypothetical protein
LAVTTSWHVATALGPVAGAGVTVGVVAAALVPGVVDAGVVDAGVVGVGVGV